MKIEFKQLEPPQPPPVEITLTLNEREAKVLYTVLGMISGPDSGPRGVTSEIFWALSRHFKDPSVKFKATGGIKLESY